jgi:hypothetical protein
VGGFRESGGALRLRHVIVGDIDVAIEQARDGREKREFKFGVSAIRYPGLPHIDLLRETHLLFFSVISLSLPVCTGTLMTLSLVYTPPFDVHVYGSIPSV